MKWLKKLASIFRRNKEAWAPFTIPLVKRDSGPHAKRGLHVTTQELKNCMKVNPSLTTPYINFDFADGTRLVIHHDRLLEWRSHIQN